MILWADSFDHYGTTPNGGRDAMLSGAWAEFGEGSDASTVISAEQARTGGFSMKLSGQTFATFARRVFGADKLEVGVAHGVYVPDLPTTNTQYTVTTYRSGANANIARLFLNSDGSLSLYLAGVHQVTSDPCVVAGAWDHVESKLVVDTATGSFECRVNGEVVIDEENINTGAVAAAAVFFGATQNINSLFVMYIDDVVTWDTEGAQNNDFLGPVRVQTLFPDATTAEADWVANGAGAVACLNNVPPDGDATTLTAATVGDVSEFTIPDLPPETAVVKGVYIPFMAKIADAGTGNIQVSMVSGGDVSLGDDVPLTTAYTYQGSVHELDPDTAAAWTKTAVEAAKVRIEKTA